MGNTNEVATIQENKKSFLGAEVEVNDTASLMDKFNTGVAAPISLNAISWTPEKIGENKRALFIDFENSEIPDEKTGEINIVPTAVFVTPEIGVDGKPKLTTIKVSCGEVVRFFLNINASKQAISAKVPTKTMWHLTYTGDRKSKNDGKRSIKNFDINPVRVS